MRLKLSQPFNFNDIVSLLSFTHVVHGSASVVYQVDLSFVKDFQSQLSEQYQ